LKVSLIQFIICPVCNQKLVLKNSKTKKNEIISGNLVCGKGHKFQIKDGIPRLVTDKTKNFIKTKDAFSEKWKNFNINYHKKEWVDLQTRWFLDRFGWKKLAKFNSFLKTRKHILDAGTGIGNSAKLLSKNTDSQVFAIDASKSIEFAYKKYGKISNIHFLQADIRQLPFKKNFFDFILSDQVLHHTKNTETSFKYLTNFLQKKGIISVYIYNKKSPIREFSDDYIRKDTVNMSTKNCIEFSKDMADLGRELAMINKKITIKRDIPILQIKKGTYDVQRFVYWYFLKCFWAEDNDYKRSVGVNFDWYSPKYAYRHTAQEVKNWYKDSKIKITHFNEIESGISVTGTKK
jgi:ubiquinone/menaquinone biosynthesis C-methylase UbiE/uncharacterized protein YbaR (Trm112 family)